MWQCALCQRLMRSSGIHRIIRTKKSAYYHNAGLCPVCVDVHDHREGSKLLWQTSLGFSAVALLCGLASYALLSFH